MEKKDGLTKILAIFGTVLIWFPVLAPFLASMGLFVRSGMVRFDYLMPAELFLSALLGGVILLWAAVRAHSRQKLIGWGLTLAAILLFGGQAIAVITGLASGRTEPTPLLMALVLTPIMIYALLLAVIGIGGAQLVRDLFKQPAPGNIH
ncbi:hypothetical protein [Candidatus Villigracilis saccharophilus]|uniref:hypothetical protein n=1 Tax=Candidatus Villigracilis saccharophilus TaxID=3140684 RepID=UPI0031373475|nr:hypothetical protein [Anaerolineales bacterium]